MGRQRSFSFRSPCIADDARIERISWSPARPDARDAQEALDYLFGTDAQAGRGSEFLLALILLDLKLPRVDGLEVLGRIRAHPHTKYVPVVIMTTSKEHDDMKSGYDLGANSYIQKPVSFEHFVQAVTQLKLYWLVVNDPVPLE